MNDLLIQAALKEDMPDGDVTTDNLHLEERLGLARLVAKEDLVLSGVEAFSRTFALVDSGVSIDWNFSDSQLVITGQTICQLRGRISSILKAERVALNFLGHMSGIATLTRCFVEAIKGTKTVILDTRKTLPGLRELEKMAVRHGGGQNHRMNLSAGVLIKENHIRLAGGMASAVKALRTSSKMPIEVEVRNLDEVREAANLKIESVLFDNMSVSDMRDAMTLLGASIKTEASGNVTLERVREIAEIGVNFISVGAITHSAPAADVSLLIEE